MSRFFGRRAPGPSLTGNPAPELDGLAGERAQLLVAYYEAARAEILQRLASRDGLLTPFVTLVAVVISVAVSDSHGERAWVLYVIPLAGFGFASAHRYYTSCVRSLSVYLRTQFQASASELLPWSGDATHWDASEAQAGLGTTARLRKVSILVIVVVPGVCSVLIPPLAFGWSVASVAGLAVGSVLILLSVAAILR